MHFSAARVDVKGACGGKLIQKKFRKVANEKRNQKILQSPGTGQTVFFVRLDFCAE
jgi:hypothetical protein